MNNKELPFVKDMFDTIAPWYDFLNRILSLRQDVSWRRITVATMNIPSDGKVLDMACGTGDVAIEIIKQKGKRVNVIGADFSPQMLLHGKNKLLKSKEGKDIYKKRKQTVEPVFGIIKEILGFRRFRRYWTRARVYFTS